jgi:hypothetical protein
MLALAAVFAMIACWCLAAQADAFIYWTDSGVGADNGTIGRANLDGSSPDDNFITGLAGPTVVAVNGQHVYWSTSVSYGTAEQANLTDGSGAENFFVVYPEARLWGVAVDSQYSYWADVDAGSIGRRSFDSTSESPSLITGLDVATGVAVDALPLAPSASITTPVSGATFTFTLNVAATVKLAFTTTSPGRLAKIKNKPVCVAPTAHNTKLRKCKRTLTAGTMSLNARSGTDKIAFQGRISPTRKLKPGTYTVTLTATGATASSAPRSLKFTIVK